MAYLDDSFLLGDTFVEYKSTVLRSVALFQHLWLQVHPDKSCLIPKQVTEFLGLLITSRDMAVKLTKEKCFQILGTISNSILNRGNFTIRKFSKLLGVL